VNAWRVLSAVLAMMPASALWAADAFEQSVAREVARTSTLDIRVLAEPTADDYRATYLMLRIAQDLDPDDAELTRRLIESAYAAGDQGSVIKQTRRLIRLDPKDTVAQLRLISWRINRLQTAEARLEMYDRFLGEHGLKLDASIRSRLALDSAMLAREVGDLDGFVRRLTFALKLDPTNKEAALLALTFFADRVNDPMGRLELMSQLLLADPLDPNVHHRIATELAGHGAFLGAARFHANVRSLTLSSDVDVPEAMRLEMMCLNWYVNGPQVILDDLDAGIESERFAVQIVVDAAQEIGRPLPDDFVMPDAIRLSPALLSMRLYAAAAVGDEQLRARALEDVSVDIREQLADFRDRTQAEGMTQRDVFRMTFVLGYDIFRAYAIFSDDLELIELAADDLRRFAAENSMISRDLEAWIALRSGDAEGSLPYFRSAPNDEIVSQIGLAMAHEALGRTPDAIIAYRNVQRLIPLGAQGCWARSRAMALMPAGSSAFSPSAPRMERFAAGMPRWIDDMVRNTSRFMTLDVELVEPITSALEPTPIRISIRNISPVPLGVGPDRPINSSFVLSPRTEIQLKEQITLVQPEVVEMARRLRLRPRETLTVEINPKMGFTGWIIETNSYLTIRTRWRVLQGFMFGERGFFVPGPNCLSTVTGAQLETLNPEALISIDQLAAHVRSAGRGSLRPSLVAVRTRLMIPESNRPALTPVEREALASACADRFAEADALTKLLMLAVLPHEGQAAEMREMDELARKDLEPRVLAMTLITRMPDVDAALLDRARALGEPWLTEIADVVESRTAAGVRGYAHATGSVRSLGGYLRGSGTLDSPEFTLPEVQEEVAGTGDGQEDDQP